MVRIVIASASEKQRTQISSLLASSGFPVFRTCASGISLRRALSQCDDALVILLGPLPGCEAEELIMDWNDNIQLLLIGTDAFLGQYDIPAAFRLALPLSAHTLLGAVDMLTQLHQMRLPRQSGADRERIGKAKSVLMKARGLTEPEAHRAIQQYAMSHGMRAAEYAQKIIDSMSQQEE